MTKIVNFFKLKKINIFFIDKKIAIQLSIGLYEGRPSYRRLPQPSKENIYKAFKNMKFFHFFHFFVGNFLPTWIRIRIYNAAHDLKEFSFTFIELLKLKITDI